MSLPVAEEKEIRVPDCITFAISAGVANKGAPVSPVAVHAVVCAAVDCSTLPASVALAFGVVVHVSLDSR